MVFGDAPLVTAGSMKRLIAACARKKASVGVLGFRAHDPSPYGRLVVGGDGGLEKIVESRDCSDAESRIDLCNSGVMCIDGVRLAIFVAGDAPLSNIRQFLLEVVLGESQIGHKQIMRDLLAVQNLLRDPEGEGRDAGRD